MYKSGFPLKCSKLGYAIYDYRLIHVSGMSNYIILYDFIGQYYYIKI